MIRVQQVGGSLVNAVGIGTQQTSGPLCVCRTTDEVPQKFRSGDVLVVPYTTNDMLPYLREAAAIISEDLAKEVDFFSIGTNDLVQYTLAIDRQNEKLDEFYDPKHPAVLRLIRFVAESGHKHGCMVGICGELGAETDLTKDFLKMGIDELSVSPSFLLKVRETIRQTDLTK